MSNARMTDRQKFKLFGKHVNDFVRCCVHPYYELIRLGTAIGCARLRIYYTQLNRCTQSNRQQTIR